MAFSLSGTYPTNQMNNIYAVIDESIPPFPPQYGFGKYTYTCNNQGGAEYLTISDCINAAIEDQGGDLTIDITIYVTGGGTQATPYQDTISSEPGPGVTAVVQSLNNIYFTSVDPASKDNQLNDTAPVWELNILNLGFSFVIQNFQLNALDQGIAIFNFSNAAIESFSQILDCVIAAPYLISSSAMNPVSGGSLFIQNCAFQIGSIDYYTNANGNLFSMTNCNCSNISIHLSGLLEIDIDECTFIITNNNPLVISLYEEQLLFANINNNRFIYFPLVGTYPPNGWIQIANNIGPIVITNNTFECFDNNQHNLIAINNQYNADVYVGNNRFMAPYMNVGQFQTLQTFEPAQFQTSSYNFPNQYFNLGLYRFSDPTYPFLDVSGHGDYGNALGTPTQNAELSDNFQTRVGIMTTAPTLLTDRSSMDLSIHGDIYASLTAFTFTGWVLGSNVGTFVTSCLPMFYLAVDANDYVVLGLTPVTGNFFVQAVIGGVTVLEGTTSGTNYLQQWHQFAFRWDATGSQLGIDGVIQLVTYTTGTSGYGLNGSISNTFGGTPTTILVGANATAGFVGGNFDDICVYSVSLTPSQIHALYVETAETITPLTNNWVLNSSGNVEIDANQMIFNGLVNFPMNATSPATIFVGRVQMNSVLQYHGGFGSDFSSLQTQNVTNGGAGTTFVFANMVVNAMYMVQFILKSTTPELSVGALAFVAAASVYSSMTITGGITLTLNANPTGSSASITIHSTIVGTFAATANLLRLL